MVQNSIVDCGLAESGLPAHRPQLEASNKPGTDERRHWKLAKMHELARLLSKTTIIKHSFLSCDLGII